MGYEDVILEDYVEVWDGCVDDLVYFFIWENFGLISVVSMNDWFSVLQYEFENVKKYMEVEIRKVV